MLSILCPLCREPLDRQPAVWRCAQGHSFDVAREGYVNLMPVQHKQSLDPGDSAQMVRARHEFLQAGYYEPLRDAVVAMLAPLRLQSLLDIGCGEGYYTAAMKTVAAEVVGLDIAKPAVRLAAKQHRGISWLVASGARLPVADGSIDAASCLFIPLHRDELQRALMPRGSVVLATPGPAHLWSLREGLFDEVRAHEPEKFVEAFSAAGFALAARETVRFPLALEQQALKQLLAMTPYVWKARPERRAALEQRESLETEAVLALLRFRKA
jgi:23S rRNA (guanine745-N1)-methyltransferase